MITDKIVKIIVLCALALILSFSLIACGKSADGDKYDGIFSPEELDWDAEHEYETYAVVVAPDAPPLICEAAECIAQKLAENTGAYAERFYAHEELPKGSDVCRILVGDVGVEETRKYLRDFRAEDIGYKYHDKCVYIGGITEESLLRAIEKFKEDVVVYADGEFFMNENTEFFLRGEYDIEEIKLGGFSLGEYTLVYPKGKDKVRDIAKDFSSKILISSGYWLPVCSDADISSESRVILLGNCDAFEEYKSTCEIDKAKIVGFDLGVMVVSEQPLAINLALEAFAERLLTADDSHRVDITVDEPIDIIFDTIDVSILTICPDVRLLSISDMISIAEKIEEIRPDIVRLECVSRDAAEGIFDNLDDKYTLISLPNDVYHMVQKDRYEYAVDSARGVDVVRYSNLSKSATLEVLELGKLDDEELGALQSMLSKDSCFIGFSSSAIKDIDGLKPISALFDVSNIGEIDTPYFAGETYIPTAYSLTEATGYTYGYMQIKVISFK